MVTTRPLVHVGYHKTASTWLQRTVFRPERGWTPLGRKGISEALLDVHPLAFDATDAARHLAVPAPGTVGVLSMERLSGHPVIGGTDALERARRVHAILPHARVLVVIREQSSWIRSYWSTYVNQGGSKPLHELLRTGARADGAPGWDPVHLEYDRTIRLYRSLFGDDAVLVAAQEAIRADAAGFVAELHAFAGAPAGPPPDPSTVHRRPRAVTTAARRVVNACLVRDRARRSGLRSGAASTRAAYRLVGGAARRVPRVVDDRLERRWADAVAASSEGRFAASNRRTAELTGLSLGELGYDLADTRG